MPPDEDDNYEGFASENYEAFYKPSVLKKQNNSAAAEGQPYKKRIFSGDLAGEDRREI